MISKITIYSKACNTVAGFGSMSEKFIRKLVINGKSKSTHKNYLKQMAKLALYYNGIVPDQFRKSQKAPPDFKHATVHLNKFIVAP
jgi:hypothetical protein